MKTRERERERERGEERRVGYREAVVQGYTGVGLDSLYSLLR